MSSLKLLEPSEEVLRTFLLEIPSKKNNEKKWLKEFKKFLINILCKFVYTKKEDSIVIEKCVDDLFLKSYWKKAFTDETANAEQNYETLEFFGDSVFSYAFSRFLYMRYKDDLDKNTPSFFSNLYLYFESNEFMEQMSLNLKFDKWVILGSPMITEKVPLSQKVRSNLIESFCAAIDFISRGVKNLLIKEGKENIACSMLFGADACYSFLTNYFNHFGFNEELSEKSTSKAFFTNRLPDVLGLKGSIKFVKLFEDQHKYRFFMEKNVIETIVRLLSTNDNKEDYKRKKILQNLNNDPKYISEDQNQLAFDIKKNIFEKQLGLTDKWIEDYKNFNKLKTIPEPYYTQLIDKVINKERYVTIKFEVLNSHDTKNNKTIVMKKVKGNKDAKTISKEILYTYTGEHRGPTFPFELRDEMIKKFLKN